MYELLRMINAFPRVIHKLIPNYAIKSADPCMDVLSSDRATGRLDTPLGKFALQSE